MRVRVQVLCVCARVLGSCVGATGASASASAADADADASVRAGAGALTGDDHDLTTITVRPIWCDYHLSVCLFARLSLADLARSPARTGSSARVNPCAGFADDCPLTAGPVGDAGSQIEVCLEPEGERAGEPFRAGGWPRLDTGAQAAPLLPIVVDVRCWLTRSMLAHSVAPEEQSAGRSVGVCR